MNGTSRTEIFCSRCGSGPLTSWTMTGAGGKTATESALCETCSGGGWTPYEAILDQTRQALGEPDMPYRDIPAAVEAMRAEHEKTKDNFEIFAEQFGRTPSSAEERQEAAKG